MSKESPKTVGDAIDQLRTEHQSRSITLSQFELAAVESASECVQYSRFHADRIRRIWARHHAGALPFGVSAEVVDNPSTDGDNSGETQPDANLSESDVDDALASDEDIATIFERYVPGARKEPST